MTENTQAPATADGGPPPIESADAAWIRVPTPFSPETLAELCREPEVLLRLNPYLYFSQWQQTGPDRFTATFRNSSNDQELSLEIEHTSGPGNGFTLSYNAGLKQRTVFQFEPFGKGSYLTVADDYGQISEQERKQRAGEVDKSLVAWGESLRAYFARIKRWSWLPGWRWYIRRMWIPMKPSARRIVWLLFLISLVEFFFFLFVLLIWVVETQTNPDRQHFSDPGSVFELNDDSQDNTPPKD